MFLILHLLYLVPIMLAIVIACSTKKDAWYLPYLKLLTALLSIALSFPLYAIASCVFFYSGVPPSICVITWVIIQVLVLYLGYRLIDICRYLIDRLINRLIR